MQPGPVPSRAPGDAERMSRPITSRMHGMLDYPAGVLLIAAPWLFGFSDVEEAAAVPIVVGVLVILQS